MGAVLFCARADLRRRWRSVAVLVLLLALAGGFALTALVGARRASTAWDRFRDETRAPDAFVSIPSRSDAGVADELRSLPGVVDAASFVYVSVSPRGVVEGGAFAAVDDRLGHSIYRWRVLEGRRADPGRDDEITVNPAMAQAANVGAGDRLTLVEPEPGTFSVEVTVVGVAVGTLDISQNAGFPGAYLTPAFLVEHADELETGRQNQFVRLERGLAGVPAFTSAVAARFGEGGGVLVGSSNEEDKSTRQALGLQAWSLALVAAAAAVATLVALAQGLARHLAAGADDGGALAAMGMTRSQLTARSIPTVLLVAAVGTGLAMALAMAASPLAVTGLTGQIEPRPALSSALVAVAVGGTTMAALVVAAGTAAGWRVSRARTPSAAARPARALGLGLPPTARIGLANATGAGTVRVRATARSAVAAAAVGALSVTAAITFAASLDHLVVTPRLFGWSFDAIVGVGGEDPQRVDAAIASLVADPDVNQVAATEVAFVTMGEENVEALVLDQRKGAPIHPPVVAGRVPTGPGEIALGAETMRRVGAQLGSTVEATGENGPVRLTVVGRAVYPVLGDGDIDDAVSFTAVTAQTLRREESRGRFALISVVPGNDPVAVAARSTDIHTFTAIAPSQVSNLRLVSSAPWVLAAFLSAVALAAVAHALVLSIRAGRRELGVLRALGFVRGQVRLTVLWQATAIVVIALVVSLPLGVAAGRWLWYAVAGRTGVLVEPVVAAAQVAAVVPIALLVANLIATVPARSAARTQPATVLRTE